MSQQNNQTQDSTQFYDGTVLKSGTAPLRDIPATANHASHTATEIPQLLALAPIPFDIVSSLKKRVAILSFNDANTLYHFDGYILDCRSVDINLSAWFSEHNLSNSLAKSTLFVLVDEQSTLVDANPHDDIKVEFVSDSELQSKVFDLKLQAAVAHSRATVQPHSVMQQSKIEEVLSEVLRCSTDWMVVKDLNHRFIYVTDRFLESHNKTRDEVIGKNDLEIGTPEDLVLGQDGTDWQSYWTNDARVIATGIAESSEHLVIRENDLQQTRERVDRVPLKNEHGDVFALLVCVTQVHESTFGNASDYTMTSRRNIECSPIIRSLDENRAHAENMARESQAILQQNTNFLASASHDIRQPLHAIGLFVDSLQTKLKGSEHESSLSSIKSATSDLTAQLNSILEISKLDANAVVANNSIFAIDGVIQSVHDEFADVALEKSLSLSATKTPFFVNSDSLLLTRLIRTLVANAVKHTELGSVTLDVVEHGNKIEILVRDTGPGISTDHYAHIFTNQRCDSANSIRENYGHGLGLSIARRLARLLEIDISLVTSAEAGSTFKLTLEKAEGPYSPSEEQISESAFLQCDSDINHNYKLLVVDDNRLVLGAMEAMLSGLGCDAYLAENIDEAVEIMTELRDIPEALPDALIVDYQLGNGMTGSDAIEAIHRTTGKPIPAVVVTGNTSNQLLREASQDAFRVMNKPVDPTVLLRTVSSAIAEKNMYSSGVTTLPENAAVSA